jgi:hypothetical protein
MNTHFLQKVPKDNVLIVIALVGTKIAGEHIRCTVLVNGWSQFEYNIPRTDGGINEIELAKAVKAIKPRMPDNPLSCCLENGKLYLGNQSPLVAAACAPDADLKALERSFPLDGRVLPDPVTAMPPLS